MSGTVKCVKMTGTGQLEVSTQPIPLPGPQQLLVKVFAAAQNPFDCACTQPLYTPAWFSHVPGIDLSGTVEAVGFSVTRFAVGDRIAAIVAGGVTTNGAFAEYAIVEEGIAIRVPEGVGMEEAAAVGVAVNTASLVFFSERGFGFEVPGDGRGRLEGGPFILIVGGSSAIGTMATQIAKAIGACPIALCSSNNFGLVESYGAEKTFDYAEEGVGKKIKELTKGSLALAVICVSTPANVRIIENSFGSEGGKVVVVPSDAPSGTTRTDITYKTGINGLEIFNEEMSFMGSPIPFNKNSREACEKGAALAERLLAHGDLKAHPIKLVAKGLDGIDESFRDFFEGKVRGFKPVFRISDTASFNC